MSGCSLYNDRLFYHLSFDFYRKIFSPRIQMETRVTSEFSTFKFQKKKHVRTQSNRWNGNLARVQLFKISSLRIKFSYQGQFLFFSECWFTLTWNNNQFPMKWLNLQTSISNCMYSLNLKFNWEEKISVTEAASVYLHLLQRMQVMLHVFPNPNRFFSFSLSLFLSIKLNIRLKHLLAAAYKCFLWYVNWMEWRRTTPEPRIQ